MTLDLFAGIPVTDYAAAAAWADATASAAAISRSGTTSEKGPR
jgi:hypothetical protein